MEHNHEDMILLHENMFKNIEKTLDELVQADKARNGRYDKHLEESIEYRQKSLNHDKDIDALYKKVDKLDKGRVETRLWAIGIMITFIGAGLSLAYWLGGQFKVLDKIAEQYTFQKK